jgi:hypothetical protein
LYASVQFDWGFERRKLPNSGATPSGTNIELAPQQTYSTAIDLLSILHGVDSSFSSSYVVASASSVCLPSMIFFSFSILRRRALRASVRDFLLHDLRQDLPREYKAPTTYVEGTLSSSVSSVLSSLLRLLSSSAFSLTFLDALFASLCSSRYRVGRCIRVLSVS